MPRFHASATEPLAVVRTRAQGQAEILAFFVEHGVTRVGIEASGSYEFEMVEALREASFEVIVFQPAQVRALTLKFFEAARQDRRHRCGS